MYGERIDYEMQELWKKEELYKKIKSRPGKGIIYFLDGPPYATGHIHVGHAQNKSLKDSLLRYWRMNGYEVVDTPGWDVHGLPIEVKVEKGFNIRNKKQIEAEYGVEKFIKMCEKFAMDHVSAMTDEFKRLGVWMDWNNPYITLNDEYIESGWWTIKKVHEKGLLYKGEQVMLACPRCETVLAAKEREYTEKYDPSTYVKFKTENGEYLLVWTTTPWTLLTNEAVAVDPNEDYVRATYEGETYIFAEKLKEKIEKETGKRFEVVEKMKGKELLGTKYESLMPVPAQEKVKSAKLAHTVVGADFVSMEEGTGLVHISPGCGEEDAKLGAELGLVGLSITNVDGTYRDDAGPYAGMFIKEAEEHILADLEKMGKLVYVGKVKHQYPICWRCKTPLFFTKLPQWFFKVTEVKEKMLEENEKVKWVPDWAGATRFKNWLEGVRDWVISRQRYWGIPLPVWECEKCGHWEVIGSKQELVEKAGEEPEELHRPYVDKLTWKCKKCGGEMKRVKDVMDVWFDSGIASWATLGYPKRKDLFEKLWPAEVIAEGHDQFRGWYYTQMAASTLVFGKAPYKSVILHGFILDDKGVKMSKSLGNVVDPIEMANKYGADVVRMHLLKASNWDDMRYVEEDVRSIQKALNILYNIAEYTKRLRNVYGAKPKMGSNIEDKWILSKMHKLVGDVTNDFDAYEVFKSVDSIIEFIVEDLSHWYLPFVKGRAKEKPDEVLGVLEHVLDRLLVLLAPITPHLADYLWRYNHEDSVHEQKWPLAEEYDDYLIKEMETVKAGISAALSLRNEHGVKRKWPLPALYVDRDLKHYEHILKEQVNVKKIVYGKPGEKLPMMETAGLTIWLDTRQTEELIEEGLLREVIRRVQSLRKKEKLVESDEIAVEVAGDLEGIVRKYESEFAKAVNAREIVYGQGANEFKINDYVVRLGVKKI